MGKGKGVYRVLVWKPEGKSHWGDPGLDGKIILRWISGSAMWEYGLDWDGLG
jgi:hypothetical protein